MKLAIALATSADAAGAASLTPHLGRVKTIQVTGDFTGSLTIEVAHLSTGPWAPVKSFTAPDYKTVEVAAAYMRVRSHGVTPGAAFTPVVSVVAENKKAGYITLDPPAPDAAGASSEVTGGSGDFATIIIGGTFHGVIGIQVSFDDTNWTEIATFQPSDTKWQNVKGVTRFVRAVSRGGLAADAPLITCASVDDSDGDSLSFGSGSDGDLTMSGDGILEEDKYYRILRTNGHTLDCAGYRLFVSELLDMTGGGVIANNGAIGAGGSGGGGGSAALVMGGADGGDGGSVGAGSAGNVTADTTFSGNSGAGGLGAGGAGGAAGVIVAIANPATNSTPEAPPESITTLALDGSTPLFYLGGGAGGGGGGGDGSLTDGGGGGGGGGVCVVSAKTILMAANAYILARGGDGEDGGVDTGGGGGGSGGMVVVNYHMLFQLGTIDAAGGSGGAIGTGTSAAGDDGQDGSVWMNAL